MGAQFGVLLRAFRRELGLTQEALAERAGLSGQAIGALERGDRRFPHRETVALLAEALGLTGERREAFVAAASRRGKLRAEGPAERAGSVPPRQLPAEVAHFTGREAQVAQMIELLGESATVAVSAIAGMGGIGKTSLAVRVGHRVAGLFPDGQLYLNLGGPISPLEALGQLLGAFGVAADEVPADLDQAAARYRGILAGRRVLLVLDNAATADQVAPLLPGTAGCAAIVTSRRALSSLPQVHHVPLDVLSTSEAIELLAATAGLPRVLAEPGAADAVVRHCGHLPLAIHLTGARLAARPHWPISHLAARLADEHRRLDELECDDVSVRASFAVTIEHLAGSSHPADRQAATAFDLLGLPDGPDISVPVASRLLEVAEDDAERILERLADLHLLETPVPGRYRQHDLLRAYARERARNTLSDDERAAAITRVVRLYVAVAWRGMELINPDSARLRWADERWTDNSPPFRDSNEALSWLDAHRPHLVGAAHQVVTTPGVLPELAVRLALGLFRFYLTRGLWHDWAQITRIGLDASIAGPDRLAEATVRMDHGIALVDLAHAGHGRYEDGVAEVRRSLTQFETLGDRTFIATCLANVSHVLEMSGDFGEAIAHGERALAVNRTLANADGEAIVCCGLGDLYGKTGDRDRQLMYYQKGLAVAESAVTP